MFSSDESQNRLKGRNKLVNSLFSGLCLDVEGLRVACRVSLQGVTQIMMLYFILTSSVIPVLNPSEMKDMRRALRIRG